MSDEQDEELDFLDFDDVEIDLADEPPRVQQPEDRPLLPTNMEVAEFSERIYGPSGTGLGLKRMRNVPIKDMKKTDRDAIIANAKKSRADYVGDADYSTFNEAWRDAATVIQERKIQETQNKKTNKKRRKRPMGGAKKSKKSKKQRKNKSRKSSRRNQKK
jgi:hypothetical protein